MAAPASDRDVAAKYRKLLLEKYEPVAVVGMGVRFPGGNDSPAGFEEFLRANGSGISATPPQRWDPATTGDGPGKVTARAGGFVDGLDEFDAKFFGISPKEANFVDPQQRLTLETAWQALEHANIDPTRLRGRNGGVYVGVGSMDYLVELGSLEPGDLSSFAGTGTAHSGVSGRLSYFLGWRGPSISLDTACSSSLVAVHLAVTDLRSGDCEIALACGVNAIHHPLSSVVFSQANMLAPDGECKTFDESADGYSRGEGCGVLVLKRLSDAKRDGDTVLALIRGSAVRQDGESAGLTVPNGTAQEAVMRAALSRAMLRPADISYVEAHGTGTPLGDPIEMGAIADVFADSHDADNPVLVGSVKTNIGHLETAAGVAGIIKTVLQLRAGAVFGQRNLDTPSPRIPWQSYPVDVPTKPVPWRAETRRALVNSFGFTGTIATVVLEQAPAPRRDGGDTGEPAATGYVFTASARSKQALGELARRYRRLLDDNPDVPVGDLCRAANVGRAALNLRAAGAVSDRADLAALLDRIAAPDHEPSAGKDVRKVVFAFTGQGSQYPGMGAGLYADYRTFRSHVDRCDALFADHVDLSVRDLLLGTDDRIHQTAYTQPALFTLEYALAKLWMSWGIRPNALIGHSIGEVTAAAVAGVLSLEDAVRLVAARGRLMQSVATPGGMVAVSAPVERVRPLVEAHPRLSVAAINAPDQCVVSGAREELDSVVAALRDAEVRTKELGVSHAFHSPLMAEVFDSFAKEFDGVELHDPELTVISCVTGAPAKPGELRDPAYWVRHIADPVDFAAGMRSVERRGRHAVVEVGPSKSLIGLGKRCVEAKDHLWLPSASPSDTGTATIRTALARLYTAGQPVDWHAYHSDRPAAEVVLPGYPFDRKRYWLPTSRSRGATAPVAGPAHHPLLGAEVTAADTEVREFVAEIGPDRPGYLADHVAMGRVVFPAAGYVELLLSLQDHVFGESTRALRDVRIHEALLLDPGTTCRLHTRFRPGEDGGGTVEVVSRVDQGGGTTDRRHVTATIGAAPEPGVQPESAVVEELRAAGRPPGERISGADLYSDFADIGMAYGRRFQRVREVTGHGPVAIGVVQGSPTAPPEWLPPAVLDAAMQTVLALTGTGTSYLPVGIEGFRLYKKPMGATLRSAVRLRPAPPSDQEDAADAGMVADVLLLDGDRPVCVLTGLSYRKAGDDTEPYRRLRYEPRWVRATPRAGNDDTGQARHLLVCGADADTRRVVENAAHATGVRLSFAADAAEAANATADLAAPGAAPTDVCWLWRRAPGEGLRAECERNYGDLLDLLHAAGRTATDRQPRLWLVTRGAHHLPDDPAGTGEQLAAASLSGLVAVLRNEFPGFRATAVDLPPDGTIASLLPEMLHCPADEQAVALRDRGRHVRRVCPVETEAELAANRRVEAGESGAVTVATPDVEPVGDEIVVRVHAAGISFKDALAVTGLLGRDAPPLGFECSGTVIAAGPHARFEPGAELIVASRGCLRRRLTVPSGHAIAKPGAMSLDVAAGQATAFTNAYHALHRLARIKPGETVAVHAIGDVGQAAVRLAAVAGAHAEVITDVTALGGRRVDVVLNGPDAEFVPHGLAALREGGRFVQLGVDIGADVPLPPRTTRHTWDLSEFDEPEGILSAVGDLLSAGTVRPIGTTVYDRVEIDEALDVVRRGAGKPVVLFDDTATAREDVTGARLPVVPDETYVITGGFGALGRVVAARLVEDGARHVALVGRRTPAAADLEALRRELGDAEVTAHAADVSDPAAVERLFAELAGTGRPVGGIVHAAGALADAPLPRQNLDSFRAVFDSKVYGSWLLHEAAQSLPGLRFFVGYSSIASVVGPPAQANYAAGNAFLDALMRWRTAQGLPGLTVNWGPWSGDGMASTVADGVIEAQGVRLLSTGDGMRNLARLLAAPTTGQTMVCEFDLARFTTAGSAQYRQLRAGAGAAASAVDLVELRAAEPAQRIRLISDVVRDVLADVLDFDGADDIEPTAEFTRLGMDSIATVALRSGLESALGVALPASATFDHQSVNQLADYLDRSLRA